jgi:hypothetical protein
VDKFPEKREGIKASNPLEELLRTMAEGIESPLARARIISLIEGNQLATPLTHNALQKEVQELLNLLRK